MSLTEQIIRAGKLGLAVGFEPELLPGTGPTAERNTGHLCIRVTTMPCGAEDRYAIEMRVHEREITLGRIDVVEFTLARMLNRIETRLNPRPLSTRREPIPAAEFADYMKRVEKESHEF